MSDFHPRHRKTSVILISVAQVLQKNEKKSVKFFRNFKLKLMFGEVPILTRAKLLPRVLSCAVSESAAEKKFREARDLMKTSMNGVSEKKRRETEKTDTFSYINFN